MVSAGKNNLSRFHRMVQLTSVILSLSSSIWRTVVYERRFCLYFFLSPSLFADIPRQQLNYRESQTLDERSRERVDAKSIAACT